MGKPIVRIEAGTTAYPFEEMTSTDNIVFGSSASPWSGAAGAEPVVGPYGLLTGGAITPTPATPNSVTVATADVMMPGADGANAATGVLTVSGAVTVPHQTTDSYRITAITVDADGDLVAVQGAGHASAFSTVRGDDGGPPLIPVGSIEIGHVRRSAAESTAVLASEIIQIPGLTVERSDYPVYEINYATGAVTFAEALPLIHVGPAPKDVYARFSTPLFAPVPYTSDWTPAESTYSVSSTDTYDGPVGSATSSLGQASFTAQLKDGITENFLSSKGNTVWVEFRPDRDKSLPKQLTQGVLGVSRTFPAGGGFSASCTVTPRVESLDVAS